MNFKFTKKMINKKLPQSKQKNKIGQALFRQ